MLNDKSDAKNADTMDPVAMPNLKKAELIEGAALQQGLANPEHAAFVLKLQPPPAQP